MCPIPIPLNVGDFDKVAFLGSFTLRLASITYFHRQTPKEWGASARVGYPSLAPEPLILFKFKLITSVISDWTRISIPPTESDDSYEPHGLR
jgi:hypothetical protein